MVMNLACGGRITVKKLARTIGEIMGRKAKIDYLPPREGDILHSYADVRLARKHLGFRPRFTLEEGLKRTIDWFHIENNPGNALYIATASRE